MWYDMESYAYMFMSGTAGPDGNSGKYLKISMMLYQYAVQPAMKKAFSPTLSPTFAVRFDDNHSN